MISIIFGWLIVMICLISGIIAGFIGKTDMAGGLVTLAVTGAVVLMIVESEI